ncbi:MAG: N-formylglutamate amidohydrolase [Roseiarcus sp.]
MARPLARRKGDPAPVTIINPAGASPFVLVCEHASNFIPGHYQRLGLPEAELLRHIAWDVGAGELTRALLSRLDATAFVAGASRLVIDCNRPLNSPTSIPKVSERPIPGNRDVDEAERRARVRAWFKPFHAAIAKHLDDRVTRRIPTAVIGVHSFTPVLDGVARPMHAGILFAASATFGRAMIADLRRDESLIVVENAPYSIGAEDWTIPTHADGRNLPGVLIEIRHDELATPSLIDSWADRLVHALRHAWRVRQL